MTTLEIEQKRIQSGLAVGPIFNGIDEYSPGVVKHMAMN